MLLEPALGLGVSGSEVPHFTPKPHRMVHVPQVSQLVQDQVIPDESRELYEAPVE